jgi:hypothetical protein
MLGLVSGSKPSQLGALPSVVIKALTLWLIPMMTFHYLRQRLLLEQRLLLLIRPV